MLNNVGKAGFTEHLLPQIRRAVSVWIRRIALTAVVAQIKRQEKRRRPRQFGGHISFFRI